MIALRQDLDDAAGDAEGPLGGLVGIGIGAQHDGCAPIPGPGELVAQHLGGIGLVEEATLEVETCGEP